MSDASLPAGPESFGPWQPIETYDALPRTRRPVYAAFWFKESELSRDTRLLPAIRSERDMGRRECTHWLPLTPPSEPVPTGSEKEDG